MNCDQARALDQLERPLTTEEERAFFEHLDQCKACARWFDEAERKDIELYRRAHYVWGEFPPGLTDEERAGLADLRLRIWKIEQEKRNKG